MVVCSFIVLEFEGHKEQIADVVAGVISKVGRTAANDVPHFIIFGTTVLDLNGLFCPHLKLTTKRNFIGNSVASKIKKI